MFREGRLSIRGRVAITAEPGPQHESFDSLNEPNPALRDSFQMKPDSAAFVHFVPISTVTFRFRLR